MKYKIRFTSAYKKAYKRILKRGYDIRLLDEVIEMLAKGKTLDPKYKDHALKGFSSSVRECHIKPDWLLVYIVEEDILTLTLTDTGTHADLFNCKS